MAQHERLRRSGVVSQRARHSIRLLLERLEDRTLLSDGPWAGHDEWLLRLSGLSGTTRDEQIAAAQALIEHRPVETIEIDVVDHPGVSGVVVIETPSYVTLPQLNQELFTVPGFVYIEHFDEHADPSSRLTWLPESPLEEEEEDIPADELVPDLNPPGFAGPLDDPSIVNGVNGFDGIIAGEAGNFRPPDSDGAVGPNTFIVAVNSALRMYQKTGTPVTGVTSFASFFSPLSGTLSVGDPIVVYNDITERFFVGAIDYDSTSNSRFDVAISKTKDPTSLTTADWNFFRYNVNDGVGGSFDFADYPKVGYNADGYVVSFNMFPSSFDHVSVIAITNVGTSAGIKVVPGGVTRFSLGPASMHTAAPGDPFWFVHTGGNSSGSTIEVVRMDNPFAPSPTYTFTNVNVNSYSTTASPHQPGGQFVGNSNLGTRTYFTALRSVGGVTHLVSTHTVGDGSGFSRVRWYDLNVTSGTPSLLQQGQVNPGGSVDTLFPGIDIAPNGTIGLQYMQSSSSQFVSMYATGRLPGDPVNTMETPVLVKAGTANISPNDRIGDYSFTSVDPLDGTFWGINEYASSTSANPNWRTWVHHWMVAGLSVGDSTPAVGTTVSIAPASYVINFTQAIESSSLQANDFQVDGIAANNVSLDSAATTATFTFGVNPITSEGPHTMHIAGGSIAQQGSPSITIVDFTGVFRLDALLLQVVSVDPPTNGTFSLPGPFTLDLNFNEAIDPASVQTTDLVLSGVAGATVTNVSVINSNTTARFTLGGMTTEGTLAASIAAGAIADANGNPNTSPFSASYGVDVGTIAIPTPLTAKPPMGSLVYESSISGVLSPSGDTDSLTLAVDSGQSITVLVTPTGSSLRPTVELRDPSNLVISSATATAAGRKVLLQTVATTDQGIYTITVSGEASTTGAFTVQVILNAALELENILVGVDNDSQATAQDLDSSLVTLQATQTSARRGAVLGTILTTGSLITNGGFESGSFSGWTTAMTGSPYAPWAVSGAGAGGGYEMLPTAPQEGNLCAWNGFDGEGPMEYTMIQDIVLPLNSGLSLSWKDRLQWNYTVASTSALARDYFVELLNPTTNSLLATLYSFTTGPETTNPTGNTGWLSHTADISAFGGSTVRLRFREVIPEYYTGPAQAEFDAITVNSSSSGGDYFKFTLGVGDTATVALKNLGIGTVFVQLIDSSGAILANGIAGPTNVEKVLTSFTAASSGTYFVRVTGSTSGDIYSLLVTKNAEFDTEANDSLGQASDVLSLQSSGEQYTLGYAGGTLQSQTLHFDELPSQPVNGLAYQGVNFGFAVGGTPSTDATYNFAGGGPLKYVQPPNLEGNASGILTLDFANPTSNLQFGVGLSASGTISPAVVVQLFDSSLNLISTTPVTTRDEGFQFTEAQFSHAGTAVRRVVLDFNENAAARFTLDNLVFNVRVTDADYFKVNLNALAVLELQTFTPSDGPGVFVNSFNPALRLFRADGTLAASDDNSAPDGKNSKLTFTNTGPAGVFYVAVDSTTASTTIGEYVLRITGNAVTPPAFMVTATSPTNGASLLTIPTTYLVDFNDVYLATSVQASALQVDGAGASAVTQVDGNTLSFTLPGSLGQGMHTVTIAAGAITDIQGTPLSAFSATFFVDSFSPRVTATSVPPNGAVAPGSLSLQLTFSEPMKVGNLSADDFSLHGNIRGVDYSAATTSYSSDGTVLTLSFTSLPDDGYTLTLISGTTGGSNFTDGAGNALDGEFAGTFPSGNGKTGGNFVMSFNMDVASEAFPTPLAPKLPLGSLVYDGSLTRVVAFAGDTDSFTVAADAGQFIAVLVTPTTAALQAVVELRDPLGVLVGSAAAASAGKVVFLNPTVFGLAGSYTFTVSGAGGTLGVYTTQITLNAALEPESNGGATNNTIATAQNLDSSAISLGNGASQSAVIGSMGTATNYSEDFELGVLPASFSIYSSNSFGRIQVTAPGGTGNTSAFALRMDSNFDGNYVLNEAVYTVNLSGVTQANLSFSHIQFSDESDFLPTDFSGHANGDGVAISANGTNWRTILNGPSDFTWTTITIDLVAAATAAGMSLGPNFKIKFQQYDNFGYDIDGRSYDNILISGQSDARDTYKFSLASGDRVSLAVKGLNAGNLNMELRNSSDTILATGGTSATNLSKYVKNFVITSTATYYATVSGDLGTAYNLVITRNADVDGEANDTFAAAQSISGTRGALGHLSGEDWYFFSVSSNNPIRLQTSTPGDGPNGFANSLNPRLELYSPVGSTGTLVASGTPLADGRNEFILYQPTTFGSYRVRLRSEAGTSGEYFLSKNFVPLFSGISSPSTISENNTTKLGGSVSDPDVNDAHSVVIDWGPGETSTTINLAAGVTNFSASHQYLDDNPSGTAFDFYAVAMTANDSFGGTVSTNVSARVNNAAPSITTLTPANIIEQPDLYTLTGTFHDNGTLDTHRIVIDWTSGASPPDGTTTITIDGPNPFGTSLTSLGNGNWSFSATHRFIHANADGTAAQVYTVGVSVTDDDTSAAVGSTTVTVNNVATLSMSAFVPGAPGSTVVLPVRLDDSNGLGAVLLSGAELALNYDTNVFTLSSGDVQLGPTVPASAGWLLSTSMDAGAGLIGVTLSRSTPATVASGNLLLITLHVKADAPAGLSRINLAAANVPNGLAATTALHSSGTTFVLRPVPTNAANDNVDGSVNVVAPFHFNISAPASVTAGAAFDFTVTALDTSNSVATGYGGTVHFTSTDGNTSLPGDATLTNGIGIFSAALKTAGSYTLKATDTVIASVTGASSFIDVLTSNVAQLIVAGPVGTVAGAPILLSVSARDQFDNAVTGYSGTVHFTSTDSQADLPGDTALTNGLGFYAGVLGTAGNQIVTATDVLNSALTGSTGPIGVTAAAAEQITIGVPSSVASGTAFDLTLTALDAYGNIATSYLGFVSFSASDGAATLPANSTLASGTGTFSVVLKAVGNQSLTVNDTISSAITTSQFIQVTGSPITHFAVSAPAVMFAGGIGVIQVSALDQFNQVVSGYSGAVTFSSTDSQAYLPPSGNLISGLGYFAVIVRTAGPQTITATDSATPIISGTSNTIAVNPGAAHHLGLSVPAGAVTGSSFYFTVSAQDAFNNIVAGYNGTVHFSSSDAAAVLASDYAFEPSDHGVQAFSAILNTPGYRTLTATGLSINGTSSAIAAHGLQVAGIIPTSTGFTARFNKPFDPTSLNLYDTLGISGQADVLLGLNAIQTITFAGSLANNSTFTLAYQGNSTAPITYTNTSTATLATNIQNALNALTNLGAGNSLVNALSPTTVNVTFQNARGFQTVALLSASPGGASIGVATTTGGSSMLRGTLVLDADNKGFTWIRSGSGLAGLMPADTYQITIRSASNGFKEPSGVQLDGDNDVVPGGNYTTTYTVAASTAATLSAPDFARGPDSTYPVRVPNNAGQETQTITFNNTQQGSTFALIFNGATTQAITYSSVASTLQTRIQTALSSLGNIDSSRRQGIQVAAVDATSVTVVFQNLMGGFDQPQMISDAGTVSVSTTTQGINTGIPITLNNAAGVTDVTFDSVYDPALLTVTGAYSNADGSTFALVGTPTGGVASFHFSLGTASALGTTATLGQIIAYVPNSAASKYKAKQVLHLANISANAGAVNVVANDAVHVVAYLGDASGDGIISSGDSGLITRVANGLDNGLPGSNVVGGFGAYHLLDPDILGDFNNNGHADSSDVTLLSAYLVRSQTQIPTPPTGISFTPAGADPTLSLPTDLHGARGETLVVPVTIDTARPEDSPGMMSAMLALRFDPHVFTVSAADIRLGSLLANEPRPQGSGAWLLRSAVNNETGEIGIDLSSISPVLSRAGGNLVTVALHVRENAPGGAWAINLVPQVNPTGQRLYRTSVADALASYVLYPAITDAVDTGVDGVVTLPPLDVTRAQNAVGRVFAQFAEADVLAASRSASAVVEIAAERQLPLGVVERAFADLDSVDQAPHVEFFDLVFPSSNAYAKEVVFASEVDVLPVKLAENASAPYWDSKEASFFTRMTPRRNSRRANEIGVKNILDEDALVGADTEKAENAR